MEKIQLFLCEFTEFYFPFNTIPVALTCSPNLCEYSHIIFLKFNLLFIVAVHNDFHGTAWHDFLHKICIVYGAVSFVWLSAQCRLTFSNVVGECLTFRYS